MLGAQLMRKATFDVDFEARTLELLKLRFVESELHSCDVMLKDIQARFSSVLSALINDLESSRLFAMCPIPMARLRPLARVHHRTPVGAAKCAVTTAAMATACGIDAVICRMRLQNSRRHLQSLQTPSTGSAAALRRLQPHVHKASLLICSQLFWPKLPDSQLELRMPGAPSRRTLPARRSPPHIATLASSQGP